MPRLSLRGLRREKAQRSLAYFVRQTWPLVEPATEYVHGWHIDAICEHLEAVTRGEIRNLIINIPPRCMKSLLVAVFWPAWVWTTRPATRWLFTSYSEQLAIRDSLKCRRVIESPWYREQWGHVFTLTDDQNQKTRFENSATGFRLAAGVGGLGTGEGGDFVVVDDPLKATDAHSDAMRTAVNTWWAETMTTRRNDPKRSGRVIIMQRLHEDDLTGHVLASGDHYETLILPAEYEPNTRVTALGWRDPRTQPDELLWPERFDRDALDALKRSMGSYAAAGQLQQRPAPLEGGLFKRQWFSIVQALPAQCRFVRYWDKAATPDGGDWSVGVLMARSGAGRFIIVDVVRGRWSPHEREQIIRQTAELDKLRYGYVAIRGEQEPGSSGVESAQATVTNLVGFDASFERVTGDKLTRAMPLAAQCEAGNVSLLAGAWNAAYLDELCMFPNGRYDDQVDGSSGAFAKLATTGMDSDELAQAFAWRA